MKSFFSLFFILGLWAGTAHAATEVQQAIESAGAALEKADSVGYEWRDSGKILNKANEAAEKGDAEQALSLATKARVQGELAYEQWQDEKKSMPNF